MSRDTNGAPSRSDHRWRAVKAAQRAKKLPCWLCGQPINYDAVYPAPDSFTADHIKPWAKYPELRLDPGNVVSAHARCNWTKNDNEHHTAGLGALSEAF